MQQPCGPVGRLRKKDLKQGQRAVARLAMPLPMPRWPAVTALAVAMAIAGGAGAAQAAESYKDRYVAHAFSPEASVKLSTTQAGASPDMTIRITSTPKHCPGGPPAPSTYSVCSAEDVHIEQEFKDIALHLPAGALANVNALPPPCDLRDLPVTFGYDKVRRCGPENLVGAIVAEHPQQCEWDNIYFAPGKYTCAAGFTGTGYNVGGFVYNGVAGPGEQAHLYVLMGLCNVQQGGPNSYPHPCDARTLGPGEYVQELLRVDASIRLRTESDWGIDAVVENMPQGLCISPYDPNLGYGGCLGQVNEDVEGNVSWVDWPVDDFEIVLSGTPGATGKPLTLNPSACSGKSLTGSFTGYAQNIWQDPDRSRMWVPDLSYSAGLSAASPPTRYPVTGCNSLPYEPRLAMELDPATPGAHPTLTSTVSQGQGEQTTREIRVRIPRSFRVNFGNTVAQCSAAQAASRSCPAEAQIGTVSAESTLLPGSGDLAGPLNGEVYVGETTSDSIKLYTVLHGFVEATIDGELSMEAGGSSVATFALPEVPQQRIVLSLLGGREKSLITAPRVCGTHTVEATFTSHQGRQVERDIPIRVGCEGASLDASLSTHRAGAHPTLTLDAKGSGIGALAFRVPAAIKVARALAAGKSYGALTFVTDSGTRSAKLVSYRRSPTRRRAAITAVEGGAKVGEISLAARKSGTEVGISGIPPGTVSASLELKGKAGSLLTLSRGACRGSKKRATGAGESLGFSATVTDPEGAVSTPTTVSSMRCKATRRSTKRRRGR